MTFRSMSLAPILALALAGPAMPAFAQAPAASAAPGQAVSQAEILKMLAEQRTLLDTQRRAIDDLERRLQETSALALAMSKRLQDLQAPPGGTPAAAATAGAGQVPLAEQTGARPELKAGEIPGDFPGAFRVPGTNAAIKFGGQVRTLFVRSIGALGSEDRFVTSSIPYHGSPDAGKTDRTVLSPAPSRLNTDLRTSTTKGDLRAFIEGDFAGSSRSYRLRHAFGQWRGLTAGQTWSTFSDPEAEPDGIDFEGLNAISMFRQPLLRYERPLSRGFGLALAIENPSPDLTGAAGISQVPDFVARIRFDRHGRYLPGNILSGRGHTQLAVVLRQLRGEPASAPNTTLSTGGVGMHVSGKFDAPWRDRDSVLFATAVGSGIGRYITDLGSLGGQDAVYDATTNALRALFVSSAYVGYEHRWTEVFRSTVTFGSVVVENLDIQPFDALHYTTRGSFNLTFSPVPRVDLVTEFLIGQRVNKDGQRGRASQLQLGWTFRF